MPMYSILKYNFFWIHEKSAAVRLDGCLIVRFPRQFNMSQALIFLFIGFLFLRLQIRCHEGCIYATRRSRAKIFYGSHDTNSKTAELPRNHEIMIFNGIEYINKILYKYLKQENCEEVAKWQSPTIYFTFAQKWFPDATPLKSMLVWAKIIPHEPHFFWDSFFHAKENSAHKSLTSMNSDLIKISMDPTTEPMINVGKNWFLTLGVVIVVVYTVTDNCITKFEDMGGIGEPGRGKGVWEKLIFIEHLILITNGS